MSASRRVAAAVVGDMVVGVVVVVVVLVSSRSSSSSSGGCNRYSNSKSDSGSDSDGASDKNKAGLRYVLEELRRLVVEGHLSRPGGPAGWRECIKNRHGCAACK